MDHFVLKKHKKKKRPTNHMILSNIYLPSSMSSSVLLCPSAIATFPLMTGFCVILGGSSVSPANIDKK